jgi:hypothetical protein
MKQKVCTVFKAPGNTNQTTYTDVRVSDPYWLQYSICGSEEGSSILDECGSESSADPDSGKIWTKFSKGKENEFLKI